MSPDPLLAGWVGSGYETIIAHQIPSGGQNPAKEGWGVGAMHAFVYVFVYMYTC